MFYVKIWKVSCQDHIQKVNKQEIYKLVYEFISEIETQVYDYTKSVLIDADVLQYNASIIVCSLISITIEIFLKLELSVNPTSK